MMRGKRIRLTEYNRPLIEHRADPYIMRAPDGTYYFMASVPEYDRLAIRHADTIQGLCGAEEKTVWTKHESGPQSLHIWAPELHYLDGRWFIYYAASEIGDKWKLRPYILECTGDDPMTDAWEERGMIQPADGDKFSFRDFSLDATILQHRGEKYFIWAEKVNKGKKISNLYIARMESPYKLATAQVLLTTPDYDWERVNFWVNEGPACLKHDGKIFMTYSASSTGACYCMGMLSVDEDADLLDPHAWKKERYPVLKTDAEKGIFGPGHNSFVKGEDGVTDYCVYHARQYEKITGNSLYDINRHAMLMKVTFDEKGFPVFAYQTM